MDKKKALEKTGCVEDPLSTRLYHPSRTVDDYMAEAFHLKSRLAHVEEPAAYSASYVDKILSHIDSMVSDIHKTVTNPLPPLEAVEYLTQALEERKCPTDNCKECRYYRPGNVEPCNVYHAIADFLVFEGHVIVKPK